jgi:hypothetical protein
MKFIRIFLWGLIAAMTIQGYLKADEYGSDAGMIGGMTLTMTVWGERARSLFGSPAHTQLPRAVVSAALQETARHPGSFGGQVPQLRRAIAAHQQSWATLHEREIAWMLRFSDFVGGLIADPTAREEWVSWGSQLEDAVANHTAAVGLRCAKMKAATWPTYCASVEQWIQGNETVVAYYQDGYSAWQQVLTMRRVSALDWWRATQGRTSQVLLHLALFQKKMDMLYNISVAQDQRLRNLIIEINRFGDTIPGVNQWIRQVVVWLLEGELWAACLEHVRQRENRVRDLMVTTGIQELFQAHDRALNASLRLVTTEEEQKKVTAWFGEMAGYAWWMGDDMSTTVRRCIGQDTGDCGRIGPTEIAAMTEQMGRAAAIASDTVRRIFIGMWNALPAVGVLFIIELMTMIFSGIRIQPQPVMLPPPPTPPALAPVVFQLESKRRPKRRIPQLLQDL